MDLEITKKFIFLLIQETFYSQENKCFDTLLKLITDDFNFNTFEKKKGLGVLCNRMTSLKKAIPNMKLSLNHFNDSVNNSAVVILMVMGIMKKPWLNNKLLPATNSYERIGLVFHIIPNKDNTKIKEVYLKSENIYQECYEKIKALDLLHTAFKLNSEKEVNKNKINKVQVNKVQDNKVQDNKVQDNKVQDNKVQDNKVQDNKVQDNKVQDNKVQDNKVQDNKVQDNKVQDNKVQDNKVQDNKVQDNKVQDNKVQDKVQDNKVQDNKVIKEKEVKEKEISKNIIE